MDYDTKYRHAEAGCEECKRSLKAPCVCGHPQIVHAVPSVQGPWQPTFACGLCDCLSFKKQK